MYCQVEVSGIGRSLVPWSPTECCVSEGDSGNSTIRRPTRGCRAMKKRQSVFVCRSRQLSVVTQMDGNNNKMYNNVTYFLCFVDHVSCNDSW